MRVDDFAYDSERLIDPIEVGKVHYLQRWLRILPKSWQRKIVTKASEKSPKMGFVVEPYAFFLFYELKDIEHERINALLPEGFKIAKSRVFTNGPEKYYGVASIFRLHTGTFWGARSEFYVIARNTKTSLLSWVILDYISDTISYDHEHGLRSAEAKHAVVTTTCEGKFLADLTNSADNRRIACEADLSHPKLQKLDKTLWIEGNTSIAYGRELATDGKLFSLTFMPEEMLTAWEIPLNDVSVKELSWFPEVFGGHLDLAACFPFAQHMLSDSPGKSTFYSSKDALRQAAENAQFDK